MNIEEYLEYTKKKDAYRFFFSEIKNTKEADLAILIEIMRAAHHITDIHKLLSLFPKDNEFSFQNDSLTILVLNLSASQLREALKLFDKLTKTNFYKTVYLKLSKEEKSVINSLVEITREFEKKEGFLYTILKPLRDTMFHYLNNQKEIIFYIQEIKSGELDRKPISQTVNLESLYFGSGADYDKDIYNNYLVFGKAKLSPLEAQTTVWELQKIFLKMTKIMTEHLFKIENIEKRSIQDMNNKYRHGYKE